MVVYNLRERLQEASELTSFSIDQVNFVFCMLLCLPLGLIYSVAFHPSRASADVRQLVGITWGLALAWFCFEWQTLILVADTTLCYWLTYSLDARIVHRYVFIVAIASLSMVHLHRQITDYGIYRLDYSGPLMILTEKVIYIAFSIHDGLGREDGKLTEDQRRHKIMAVPHLLQFYGYMFHYSMLLCGPLCTFKEYVEFIEGKDVKPKDPNQKEPWPWGEAIRKAAIGIICALALCAVGPQLDPHEFLSKPLLNKMLFAWWGYVLVARLRYYFAFKMAEAVNNMCGLGFSGHDENGNPTWNGMANVTCMKLEFPLNMKMVTDNWNIKTAHWLRRTAYDRIAGRYSRVIAVFLLSAVWHGFYPGYYLTFLTCGLMVEASRVVRRKYRESFQGTRPMQILYDLVTCTVTIMCVTYTFVPFVLLDLRAGLEFWRSTYFFGHVMCVTALILCRDKKSQSQESDKDPLKGREQFLTAVGLPYVPYVPYVGNAELKWIWIKFMSAVCGTVPLLGTRQK